MSDVSAPEKLPDPTKEYPAFVWELMEMGEQVNMHQFKSFAKAHKHNYHLWVICVSEHVSQARVDNLVEVGLTQTPETGDQVNWYRPTEAAKQFFANAREDKRTPEETLRGWAALQSIMYERVEDEDGNLMRAG